MKAYVIQYRGLWMGGTAVVIAKSKKKALQLVENDPSTVAFEEPEITDIIELDKPKILYNDNGDY